MRADIKTFRGRVRKALKDRRSELYPRLSAPSKIAGPLRWAWSVPAWFSCPGRTRRCGDACYAQTLRHAWPASANMTTRNLRWLNDALKSRAGLEEAARELADKIDPNAVIFRVHEGGDFHTPEAVAFWAEVARLRPDVDFFAYTRSFDFNFDELLKLSNWTLWASADPDNRAAAQAFRKRHNWRIGLAWGPHQDGDDAPRRVFWCPVTTGEMATEGACLRCRYCTKKQPAPVGFYQHG